MGKLGFKVKDKISGIEGVTTGFVEYITGCNQYLICPKSEDNQFRESIWIDEVRLEFGEQVFFNEFKDNGFDKAPTRMYPTNK